MSDKNDYILEYLKENKIPVTRENYILVNSLGDNDGSQPLDAEDEAELPEELQIQNQKEKQ